MPLKRWRLRWRQNISSEDSTIRDVLHWYNSVNAAMLAHLTDQIKETDNSGVWRRSTETSLALVLDLSCRKSSCNLL
ncbi:unnamed protein product [Nezara viridula]|uniref:Uncharacterized protein n=1 Tax=Nezara viridula TaxID=85310 RepID=A0A9P0MU36_NEZVI|nr:unnamed protein product [Nezara viridula]